MSFDDFLKAACPPLDLNWRKYRRRAARHRLQQRLKALGLAGYEEYLALLAQDPREAATLPDRLRITVTRFFRDKDSWETLGREVLPGYLRANPGRTRIKAWSAGCCGGEEPYSLALLWLETAAPLRPVPLTIWATDIDPPSLTRAAEGRYAASALREIPAGIRECWFEADRDGWRIKEAVKAGVTFQEKNLMIDDPPTDLDLVLCRYLVFTYYRAERRRRALDILLSALGPRGILMIGRKESLKGEELERLTPAVPGSGIFFKKTLHFGSL